MSNNWILEVEDNENDAVLLQLAFAEVEIQNPVHVVRDGQQAIDYLAGTGRFSDRGKYPMPRLVVLDLNLPMMTGLEVLSWIRRQPALRALLVILFSSSEHPADVAAAYHLGATSYYVKPHSIKERTEIAREIKSWFLSGNDFPKPGHPPRAATPRRAERTV